MTIQIIFGPINVHVYEIPTCIITLLFLNSSFFFVCCIGFYIQLNLKPFAVFRSSDVVSVRFNQSINKSFIYSGNCHGRCTGRNLNIRCHSSSRKDYILRNIAILYGHCFCSCAITCLCGDGVNSVGHIAKAVLAIVVCSCRCNTDTSLIKGYNNIAFSGAILFYNTTEGIERISAPLSVYSCISCYTGFTVPRSSTLFIRVPSCKVVAGFFR